MGGDVLWAALPGKPLSGVPREAANGGVPDTGCHATQCHPHCWLPRALEQAEITGTRRNTFLSSSALPVLPRDKT